MNNSDIANTYQEKGFVFPVPVVSSIEAAELLSDLESAEAELAKDDERRALLHSYPDRVLPSFDSLIRHPEIINRVSQILGPDLHVWSASLFDKAANSRKIVTWHQDLTYWGLDEAEEVTAWVALTPATEASGCMYFIPGSHEHQQVQHQDTFSDNNLLSRGQEIAVEVNEDDAVAVVLQPGEASLHHGHLFHSSGPNSTGVRRTAAAIRYIKTSMKQRGGQRALVAHVSGEDQAQNFKVADSPVARLQESDFELCREDAAIKRQVLYAGAEQAAGARY